jgi:HEAT repeat-containing protein 5
MVKLAVLSAWAELQIQTTQREYLVDIVAPRIGTLISMWFETLIAYAKLQFEPDIVDGTGTEELMVDAQYANASKEFLLQASLSISFVNCRFIIHVGSKS